MIYDHLEKVENCSNYKTISRCIVLLITAIISAVWLRYHHFMSQIRLPLIRIITRSWSMDRVKFFVNSFAIWIFNLHESVFSWNSNNFQEILKIFRNICQSVPIKTWNIFTKYRNALRNGINFKILSRLFFSVFQQICVTVRVCSGSREWKFQIS